MNLTKPVIFIIAFLLAYFVVHGQRQEYAVHLVPGTWSISPDHYFISRMIGKSADLSTAGEIFFSDHSQKKPVRFEGSLGTALMRYLENCIRQDTSKVPVILIVDRFQFSDRGSSKNHVMSLDFNFRFCRMMEGKEIMLFESHGKPTLNIRGPANTPCEMLINHTLSSLFNSFDKWANENAERPEFCKKLTIDFDTLVPANGIEQTDTIRWSPEVRLQWKDFQGTNKNPSSFSALSNCCFIYSVKTSFSKDVMHLAILIYAGFAKKSSWVKPGMELDPLLEHEQVHFDICEIHVRELKRKIAASSLSMIDFNSQIRILLDESWEEYMKEQDQYDRQTTHGTNATEQKNWKTRTDAALGLPDRSVLQDEK